MEERQRKSQSCVGCYDCISRAFGESPPLSRQNAQRELGKAAFRNRCNKSRGKAKAAWDVMTVLVELSAGHCPCQGKTRKENWVKQHSEIDGRKAEEKPKLRGMSLPYESSFQRVTALVKAKRVKKIGVKQHSEIDGRKAEEKPKLCLLYTSPSPRDLSTSRMPSSA